MGGLVVAFLALGLWLFLSDRQDKRRADLGRKLVGNWELVERQAELDRWELAFHSNGRFQMQTHANGQSEVSDGKWKVTRAEHDAGDVRIDWPGEGSELMRVRFGSAGVLSVHLPSAGEFNFRAVAAPGVIRTQ